MSLEDLRTEALQLSPADRLLLADELYQSVSETDELEMDARLKEELERRIREIDEGRAELIEHREVIRRVFGEDTPL